MNDFIQSLKTLAVDKLNFHSPVKIQREWLLRENKAYLAIMQNGRFVFQIPCEANEVSLSENEELAYETLSELGFKVTRSFSH